MNSNNEIKYMIDLVRNLNESIESGKFIINERNPIGLAAKEGRFGAKELKPIFDDLIKAGSSTEALLKKVGVKNSDDLLKLVANDFLKLDAKLGSLAAKEASSLRANFELSILKNKSGIKKELLDIAASNLVKDNRFISNYKQYSREADLVDALKKKGYSDQGANAIAKARSNTKINTPKPKKTAGGGNTNLTPANPKPTIDPTFRDKLKNILNKFPKANWKQILKWGAGIGISGTVLWWLFHDNDDIPAPDDIPPTEETIVDDGGGGGGSGTGFIDAPSCEQVKNGESTMSKGMMGDCVGTVQSKLNEVNAAGLKVDNKFGKLTKKAVENFQTKNSIEATGIVDKTTYEKLFGTATAASTGSDYEEAQDTVAGAEEDF
jgi:hypothetical protein